MASPWLGRSRLPEHLARVGKLQVDLALHLNVSEPYMSRVCNSEANLSVYNMRKTAKFLKCKMDDLVDWDGVLR